MPFAFPFRDDQLALQASEDRVDLAGVRSVIGPQQSVDRDDLHSMEVIGDLRHDEIPPCQLAEPTVLDLGELEGLQGHLAAMIVAKAKSQIGPAHHASFASKDYRSRN
jgi:hypothetical protein